MDGKQVQHPPWARRHTGVVALIGLFAIVLGLSAVDRGIASGWLLVPGLALAGPALVSALPRRSHRALASASAAALVMEAVFAIAAFGTSVRASLVLVAVLCVIALYESGVVLAAAFGALTVSVITIALIDPAILGLANLHGTEGWTTGLTMSAATLAIAVSLVLLWRDQRRATHIADQQRLATEAYLEVAGTLMLVLDRNGIVTVANRQTCLTLDLEEDDIVGREWFELALPHEYAEDARRLFRATFDHYREFGQLIQAPQDYENEILTRDRQRRSVQWWATFVTDMSGRPTGMVCSGTDVTDARAAAAAIERNRVELDALRRLAQKVASLDDSRQAVVDATLALTDATIAGILEPDRTRSQLTTTVATDPMLVDTTIELGREASIASTAFLSGQPQFIAQVAGAQGTNQRLAEQIGVVSAIHQPIVGANGVIGILTVGWDYEVPSLQERKAELVGLVAHEAAIALRRRESLEQLERAALIDPLTGVANRRAFDAELPLALRRASEGNYPLALVMIDLNDFKAVNDLYGHEAGDHVLIGVATGWADALRAGDLLARVGGDEFAVLLPTCDEHEMAHIIQRLHRATASHHPGASIGGALWDGSETVASLIRRADRSQYADKARAKHPSDPVDPPAAMPAPRPRAEDPRGEPTSE